jgi:hypothetical protein
MILQELPYIMTAKEMLTLYPQDQEGLDDLEVRENE